MEKARPDIFTVFLGFGTNENTNKIEFDGYLDLRLINNLNYGETLNLFYKSDEIDQQTINVDLDLPYLFTSPIGLQVGLNLFRKDSTFLTAKQYAKINYQINLYFCFILSFTFTFFNNNKYLIVYLSKFYCKLIAVYYEIYAGFPN